MDVEGTQKVVSEVVLSTSGPSDEYSSCFLEEKLNDYLCALKSSNGDDDESIVNVMRSILHGCFRGSPKKSAWCCIELSDEISSDTHSPSFIQGLTEAVSHLKTNFACLHSYLGVVSASYKLSLSTSTAEISKLWLKAGVSDILNELFENQCPVETRKLAWDLAFLLVSAVFKPQRPNLGFALTDSDILWEVKTIMLLLKLFGSFTVTFPAHFPFMPLKYYESVCWPLQNIEMCHGKLSSLFSYSYDVSQDVLHTDDLTADHAGDSALSTRSSEESNVPGTGVCLWHPSRKRQPWTGKFTFLGMFSLYQRLAGAESRTQSGEVFQQVSAALILLRSTLLKIYDTEPKLTKRDRATAFLGYRDSVCCEACNKKFSLLNSFFSLSRKHHCKICCAVVCGECSMEKSGMMNAVAISVKQVSTRSGSCSSETPML